MCLTGVKRCIGDIHPDLVTVPGNIDVLARRQVYCAISTVQVHPCARGHIVADKNAAILCSQVVITTEFKVYRL
ncbi:hypothetical protein C4A43_03918 [Escherichia coli]|nr:hypothetical protein C4A43_03918 [Escherichia coli]